MVLQETLGLLPVPVDYFCHARPTNTRGPRKQAADRREDTHATHVTD